MRTLSHLALVDGNGREIQELGPSYWEQGDDKNSSEVTDAKSSGDEHQAKENGLSCQHTGQSKANTIPELIGGRLVAFWIQRVPLG